MTGSISEIIVIDCDSVEAISSIESMMDQPTTTARTSRGRHYYFKHPGGVISSCEELLPGVDVRADKGYVLAPGSLHPSGFEYAWINTPWDVAPAPLPDALRAMVIARNTESRRIGALSLPPPVSPHRYRIGRTILRSESERLCAIPLASGHGKQRAMAASAFRMGQLVATGYMTRAQGPLLASEASGILNLALEGYRLYMEDGSLHIPASLRTLTDHHRQQSDPLSKFFEDCCEMDAEVEKGRLYGSFIQWARMNGEAEVAPKRFGMWMIQRGFKERKSGSFRTWAGVRLFSGTSMSPTSASPFLTESDESAK